MSRRRVTKKDFFRRSHNVHGNRCDNSRVELINVGTKVVIICPEHGPFEQMPYMQMRGHGCRRCSLQRQHMIRRISFTEAKAGILARFPHNQIDRSTSTSASDLVDIHCPIHGGTAAAKTPGIPPAPVRSAR